MKRRFKKVNVSFLSLCPRGVNRLPVIYKAEGTGKGALDLDTIIKASEQFDDNGELTAVVYAPEFRDSEGDIASQAVIKEAMYDAARNGVSIDMRHNEKAVPKSAAFIAESFIVQKDDPRFIDMKDYAGQSVDVTGGWAVVIKVEDAALRKSYRSGEWNGISMGGTAAVEVEKSDDVIARLEKLLNKGKDDLDMDKKELGEVLAENNKSLATAIIDGIAKAIKPAEPAAVTKKEEKKEDATTAPTEPVFKGDMGKPADVKAHQIAVKKFKLAKECDFNNDESVEKYLAEIAKLDGKKEEKKVEKSDEVVELEKQLAEAQKRSNQSPVEKEAEDTNTANTEIKKDDDLFKMGKGMATAMNTRRGYAVAK